MSSIRLYDKKLDGNEDKRDKSHKMIEESIQALVRKVMDMGIDEMDLYYAISQKTALAISFNKIQRFIDKDGKRSL